MSSLSTHILDLTSGKPATEVVIRLIRLGGAEALVITTSNVDGRARLAEALPAGGYRLEFEIGTYFRNTGAGAADPGFLEGVAIEFQVADKGEHYHVPLLVSPFGYSTYRGS